MLYCRPAHVIQPFWHKNPFSPDQNLSRVCMYEVCMRASILCCLHTDNYILITKYNIAFVGCRALF